MKKILLLALAITTLAVVNGQQITLQPDTTWRVPRVNWSGADAQVVAAQLFSMTNAAGQPLVSIPALVPATTLDVNLRMVVDALTNIVSISAGGQQE